ASAWAIQARRASASNASIAGRTAWWGSFAACSHLPTVTPATPRRRASPGWLTPPEPVAQPTQAMGPTGALRGGPRGHEVRHVVVLEEFVRDRGASPWVEDFEQERTSAEALPLVCRNTGRVSSHVVVPVEAHGRARTARVPRED